MQQISRWGMLAIAVVLLATAACLPKNLQSLVLYFTLTETVPAGQRFELQTTVFRNEIKLKGQFVRISGRLEAEDGTQLPPRVTLTVVSEDLDTGSVFNRFSVPVRVKNDGTFTKSKKFERDLPPDTMQTVSIVSQGAEIPAGTLVNVCVDIAKTKRELKAMAPCSESSAGTPPPNGENNPPTASIVASPTSVPRNDNNRTVVTIDGSGSSDPDGDALSFAWTVQSGTFVEGTTPNDAVIKVTFPGAAPYAVNLVVDDGRGGTDTASTTIGLS